jgi:hypothetical protein
MAPTAKKLRPYQVRLVTDVCRASEDILVEQPTGSGKTVQIVTLVAMHLGRRFTHALIAAPQEQIEEGFVKRDYQVIAFPDCQGVAQPAFEVPKKLILGARRSGLGSVKQITAVTTDLAWDPYPGDILMATVQFLVYNQGGALVASPTAPVGLVNAGDTTVGMATVNVSLSVDASGGTPYTVITGGSSLPSGWTYQRHTP